MPSFNNKYLTLIGEVRDDLVQTGKTEYNLLQKVNIDTIVAKVLCSYCEFNQMEVTFCKFEIRRWQISQSVFLCVFIIIIKYVRIFKTIVCHNICILRKVKSCINLYIWFVIALAFYLIILNIRSNISWEISWYLFCWYLLALNIIFLATYSVDDVMYHCAIFVLDFFFIYTKY